MNHPNSPNGKIDALLAGQTCFCGNIKKSGKPMCYSCWEDLSDKAPDLIKPITFGKGQARYDAIDEAAKELGYTIN